MKINSPLHTSKRGFAFAATVSSACFTARSLRRLGIASFCVLGLVLAGRAHAQSTYNFEAENLTYTPSGATASVQTDAKSSGGHWVLLSGNSVGDNITFAIPSIVAGTYQLQMEWKGLGSRGILQLSVDGANLGPTLDQYSSSAIYPTTTFGTVTFASAGTHTVRLTVTGKNSASSGYGLSADKFTFVGQSTGQVAAPTFSPAGGTYSSAQNVSIATSTPGATIRYTTDGSVPSETVGTIYSGSVNISATTTLQAIAYESGMTDSAVTSATYTIGSGTGGTTVSFEAENLSYTPVGATASVQTDSQSSGGHWVLLAANSVGDNITFAIPSVAAGSYQLQMEWKGLGSRGILQLSVDGTNLGPTLDQYSSSAIYPTTTFGTVNFASAGTHNVRLTVTGKNSASSGYGLSADKFTFLASGGTTQVAAPSFSPGGGTYSSAQSVTMNSATTGATIRYTTDGSTPSETNGTIYSGPVSISSNTLLQAIAYESGMTDSVVTSATYTIGSGGGQVATPSFSPAAGTYGSTQNVSISTSTGGATIRYTTDGSTPTETHGTVYSGPVSISSTTTMKAVAYESGLTDSAVASATYTIAVGGGGKPNGNPILPPKWAFGVMFGCYDNQSSVLSDMTQLRNSYCGDLIWVDSSWLSSNYNGPASNYIDFKFDSTQFSDPAGMINTLHSNHFHFGVWEWPWIGEANQYYSTGASNHYFIETSSGSIARPSGVWHGLSSSTTAQFDLSTTTTADWWKSLNAPLFNMGFDFLKMDTTVGIPSGGVLKSGSTSSTDWKGFYHRRAWEITSTAKLAQGRGFLLAHSDAGAATNNDQYPGLWTGDSSASFSSMVSKDMGGGYKCNTKTSGAYWCGDTGGYNNNSNDELYQRWLQYGCFTPLTEFFGAKGTKGSTGALGRFPWCFGSTAIATFSHYSQLRYQLLPYRYSNAQACYHVTGGSVQYPVWWPNSQQIINGHGSNEILVQPVTTSGATSASVTFPSGTNWIDYDTGTIYAGGTTSTISAPVTRVPMFVSAGAIIPMLIPYDANGNAIRQNYVDEYPANQLTLDIYPSGSTSYTFYEDDGISDLYITDNEFSTTLFSSNNTSGHEVFTIGAANGSFVGQFTNRTYYLKINQQGSAPAGVTRDGNTVGQVSSKSALVSASQAWYYDSSANIVWVKFSTPTNVSTSVSLH